MTQDTKGADPTVATRSSASAKNSGSKLNILNYKMPSAITSILSSRPYAPTKCDDASKMFPDSDHHIAANSYELLDGGGNSVRRSSDSINVNRRKTQVDEATIALIEVSNNTGLYKKACLCVFTYRNGGRAI